MKKYIFVFFCVHVYVYLLNYTPIAVKYYKNVLVSDRTLQNRDQQTFQNTITH